MGQIIPALNPSFRELGDIAGINYKVGAIKRMATQSCNPSASLAVLAMWSAAPTLVWSLFGPDCVDLVADRAGGGHRRRRAINFRQAGIIPGEGQGSGFGWALFKLGSLGQRAGWYFSILDATTDFVVNWMSLAMIYDGCSGGGNPFANGKTDAPGTAKIFPNIWVPLTFADWDFGGGIVGAGATVAFLGGTNASGTASGYLTQADGLPPPNIFKIRIVDNNDTVWWEGVGDDPYGSGIKQMSGWYERPAAAGGGTLQAQYWLDIGGMFTGSWNVAGIEGSPDWPTITGAPCASNIESDMNWEEYWHRFLSEVE